MDRKMSQKCLCKESAIKVKTFTRNSSITMMRMNLGDKEEYELK